MTSYNGGPEDPRSMEFGRTHGLLMFGVLQEHIRGLPLAHLADRAIAEAVKIYKPEPPIDERAASLALTDRVKEEEIKVLAEEVAMGLGDASTLMEMSLRETGAAEVSVDGLGHYLKGLGIFANHDYELPRTLTFPVAKDGRA